MADEPTPWELKRNYESLRADMRDGFKGVNDRLDKLPNAELYAALFKNQDERIRGLEQDLVHDQQGRRSDRRLVVGAVLAGAVSILVQIITNVLSAKGIG